MSSGIIHLYVCDRYKIKMYVHLDLSYLKNVIGIVAISTNWLVECVLGVFCSFHVHRNALKWIYIYNVHMKYI